MPFEPIILICFLFVEHESLDSRIEMLSSIASLPCTTKKNYEFTIVMDRTRVGRMDHKNETQTMWWGEDVQTHCAQFTSTFVITRNKSKPTNCHRCVSMKHRFIFTFRPFSILCWPIWIRLWCEWRNEDTKIPIHLRRQSSDAHTHRSRHERKKKKKRKSVTRIGSRMKNDFHFHRQNVCHINWLIKN